ncbi:MULTISPECIES: ABC transporter ATP-binding protein [unclassified Sporosarcina]|uniref:ABC transporter ATP-binding protein n=1 Tax=unclassified Sporosarcina TaxID=2647733 RepID=UPI001A91A7D4|nr:MULTISPECIES: ABC transporter ATP-binding protein [unclassified Sporosarcina]MBO0587575.1 ABC transporter ATP-binding protein [Sporosarcina sp. E16_8]MBO0602438.1 ABC transporter ATP-binding protein [Sporosarcina sp. E16_3]
MENIVVKNVSKHFKGDGVEYKALSDVSIEFTKGEFVSIMGPSGSGKSTLLSIMGTLDQQTSGQIYFEDKLINGLGLDELADIRFNNIGFVFQQFHLLATLTALENVLIPLFNRTVNFNKKERAIELLNLVGLADKLNSFPSQLSGGQQQRVAIARALIARPDWILADEPTGNLDTNTGNTIFELLQQLNRDEKCGVIFVTHDLLLAEKAERIIEMKDGSIIKERAGRTV